MASSGHWMHQIRQQHTHIVTVKRACHRGYNNFGCAAVNMCIKWVFNLQEGLHAVPVNQPIICKWYHDQEPPDLKSFIKETRSICIHMLSIRQQQTANTVFNALSCFLLETNHVNRPVSPPRLCSDARLPVEIKVPHAITTSLLKAINNSKVRIHATSGALQLSRFSPQSKRRPPSHTPCMPTVHPSIRHLTSAVNLQAQHWRQAV